MKSVVLFLFLASLHAAGQLVSTTLVVNETPVSYTPLLDTIFVAGTFNNWNPADPEFAMSFDGNSWSITINGNQGEPFEYKFTRGSWATVEGNTDGQYIANRAGNFVNNSQLNHTIEGFEDFPSPHTGIGNTHVLISHFNLPQLGRNRKIWVQLPADYYTSTYYYPVLYMQDGQNLFDAGTSFSGEWEIDESMLDVCQSAIIVGIENGAEFRIDEYSPWINPQYGGGEGALYAAFIVETLKPFIDSYFRTLPAQEFTGIGGSSLGALISAYTALEYPEVFGKILLFSPSFWFSGGIFASAFGASPAFNQKFYLCAGTNESNSMIPDMFAFKNELLTAGISVNNIQLISHADGEHSEWFWAREFESAYSWLFCDNSVVVDESKYNFNIQIFPNPADSFFIISSSVKITEVLLFNSSGIQVKQNSNCDCYQTAIDTANLASGIYSVQIVSDSNIYHYSIYIK